MSEAAIGVFDSGVGGLSVLREIRAQLPAEDLLYVADSGAAPYGERTEEFIRERVRAIVEFFLRRQVKAIVVACNTATAVAVELIRSQYDIPVVAVEPAVKPAAALTKSGVIGVLATSRTLSSERFARLAGNYGEGVTVLLQACPGFVEQVEKGELDSVETRGLVQRYVGPLIDQGVDTLVLGCTHYPFLRAAIQAVGGQKVHILDSSDAVARHVRRRLESEGLLSQKERAGVELFWTSGEPELVAPVISKLWGRQVAVHAFPG